MRFGRAAVYPSKLFHLMRWAIETRMLRIGYRCEDRQLLAISKASKILFLLSGLQTFDEMISPARRTSLCE
jgi:hypothetical protein